MKKTIIILMVIGILGLFYAEYTQEKVAGASQVTYPQGVLPPKGYGVPNPNITQANINQTICNPNWSTKSIRPPTFYTNKLKKQQLDEMGYKDKNMADYEEDHIISLELAGSPTDPHNLYPQPYNITFNGELLGARQKDKVENYLHKQVCNGKMTLQEAQNQIRTDWVGVYYKIK